jgi:hypothetical protein
MLIAAVVVGFRAVPVQTAAFAISHIVEQIYVVLDPHIRYREGS